MRFRAYNLTKINCRDKKKKIKMKNKNNKYVFIRADVKYGNIV